MVIGWTPPQTYNIYIRLGGSTHDFGGSTHDLSCTGDLIENVLGDLGDPHGLQGVGIP